MKAAQTPEAFIAAALLGIAAVFARIKPGMVLVQGDTATMLAGGLAAAYARIPLGHVEAGLRSHAAEPFPEDLHRRLVAQAATHHFAPTAAAGAALVRGGIAPGSIAVTGNPVIDALRLIETRLAAQPVLQRRIISQLPALGRRPLVVVTAHRRENHGRMGAIASAIATLAQSRDIDIVVPVHPNPAAGAVLRACLDGVANVALVPPLDYFAFVTLLRRARLVLTDSGGVQEEAPALGCPVLILRDSTERPEGIDAGVARLVGTGPATIVAAAQHLLDDDAAHAAMAEVVLPYGDGHAAGRIAGIVVGALAAA